MNKTQIEWVKNPDGTQGFTWNPITGCLNGCEYCYARKLANGRLKSRYLANKMVAPVKPLPDGGYRTPVNIRADSTLLEAHQADPFYPRFWEDRLQDIYKGKKGKGIFVCDMSDLFGIGVPEEWTRRVLNEIRYEERRYVEQNRYYLLTKQPQNLIKFSPFPENVWCGVTATNPKAFNLATYHLARIEAKVKYISLEPLLEWDLEEATGTLVALLIEAGISWVIIGSQTRPTVMPKIEWVEEIVQACDKARIPVFLKNNLERMCFSLTKSQLDKYSFWEKSFTDDEFIVGVDLRQELPSG